MGIYCIPCLDCSQCYIGETGRGLDIRLDEHKRSCRLGNQYSAVATHSLELEHRIGFGQSKIIYKCEDRNTRKTVEGALIELNDTFHNNKSATREGSQINLAICHSIGIKDFCNISATLRTAASPLRSQVSVTPRPGGSHGTGAYAERTHPVDQPPEPPDLQVVEAPNLRRSARLRAVALQEN